MASVITVVSFCMVQELVGTGVLFVDGVGNILMNGENKMKAWVVLADDGNPMEFSTDPWGDGDCLTNNLPLFTVFCSVEKARNALKITKKYAKDSKIPAGLYELWDMKSWKVKEIEIIPNLELI